MKKFILTSLLIGLASSVYSAGTDIWTLERCIEYAQANNISLQQMQLQQQMQEVSLNTARHGMDPSVSFSLVASDYIYPNNKDLSSISFNPMLSASTPLFDGFATRYNKKMNEWSLASITAQFEQLAKDITITVATYYLQVLYLQGRVEICRKQVEVGEELYRQISLNIRTGRFAESRLSEVEALQASYEYDLTSTQGAYEAALLSLEHLLYLPADSNFSVAPIEGALPEELPMTSLEYYNLAIDNYPQIKASQATIEKNKAMESYYKSQMYPSLYLGANLSTASTSYYNSEANRQTVGQATEQWKRNLQLTPFLQLNIPIYNKRSVVNNIRSARLNISSSELSMENALISLRETIEQNWMQANNAILKYAAAVKSEESSRNNYQNTQLSYSAGRADFYNLSLSRQLWVDAQDRALQARYEYLIRRRILDYYINNTF